MADVHDRIASALNIYYKHNSYQMIVVIEYWKMPANWRPTVPRNIPIYGVATRQSILGERAARKTHWFHGSVHKPQHFSKFLRSSSASCMQPLTLPSEFSMASSCSVTRPQIDKIQRAKMIKHATTSLWFIHSAACRSLYRASDIRAPISRRTPRR